MQIERGMLPENLLFDAAKKLIKRGRIGISPSKQFLLRLKIFTDEFTKTSTGPSKLLIELFGTNTEEGSITMGTFPLILLFDMPITSNFSRIFKTFGNLVMPQPDKNNTSKFVGMCKFVSKLAGDILLPERSRYDKDFSEEKGLMSTGELVFRKERSRSERLMSCEIGSMIFPSK